ncbi:MULTISPECIES: ATP-binding cassette domain-containing protein [unclassified Acidovorax]|uniref:ABC-F family ATP-binding cassette domain-containing protein n=1 Tax=unclassified Acidovorax TaxID=2684926 RepID=UPI000BCE090B|nr:MULTISPECIES: ATP-binding cassette domain-containing protein [unclassified Acidovorax]OZA58012.1 MAG: ABC transporter [Acidovorax sp. 17-64-282]HQS21241.1 ATP-binding cassette domain-containing protein [Acidovorax defluvii]OYY28240.1 MAG: ABC transporter [Acidovorax sp. 35-64-16]OYY84865.1 MAG: ABC transporter [Acidovorax sp. 28-64-14]OYZ45717.1 MAG: ABC transporter [Acidovorax sp. 16-64-162]
MITLKNVTLRRGAKVLLNGVNATINPGEKAGLVGRNGAGKSSLFALLNGSLHEDGGDFYIPTQWRMAQVAQNMPETDEPATAFVVAGDTRLTDLQAELAKAEAADDGMAIAHAYTDLADAGAHDAEPRAQALILGLGFKVSELDKPVNSFSGGWRMRLQLARALMCPSDLLLLDEPTNHLDLDALVWLEAWLKRYEGTMIVISHDREFLDAVTNVTMHIDNAQITRYGGNYSKFEDLRAQQLELQQASFSKQQEKIAHLKKFIDRFKAKASKAKQAQSRVKALDRMEKIAPLLADAEFTFEFKEPQNLPNPMLAISDASFGYRSEDGAETTILQNVSRSVLAGQRIGILGANGQGKSTLVKTIARTMAPLAGTVTEGKGLSIGYFAQQELDVLRPHENPLEHMIRLARELGPNSRESSREQDLRSYLGTFNFTGDMVKQSVGSMSGGEKARLVLAMIVWQRPNLLLLDEPTNHLDLATREALSMALNEFEGTVMLVSHDRALLRAVCDEFWMVGRGAVGPFDGDLDDYQRYLLDEAKRQRELAKLEAAAESAALKAAAPAPAVAAAKPVAIAPVSIAASADQISARGQNDAKPAVDAKEQRKQDAQTRQQLAEKTRPLKRELEQIDQRLSALVAERADLEQRLTQPLPPAEIADLGRRLKAGHDETAQLEERWLEISAGLEELGVGTSA